MKPMSRHFHAAIQALTIFAKEMIKPPLFDETPLEILKNMKNYPWFKNCIGATDVAQIPAIVQRKPFHVGLGGKTIAHRMS